jgi:hypothetical protein
MRVVYNAIKAAEPRMGGAQAALDFIPCVRYFVFCMICVRYFVFCMGFDTRSDSSRTRPVWAARHVPSHTCEWCTMQSRPQSPEWGSSGLHSLCPLFQLLYGLRHAPTFLQHEGHLSRSTRIIPYMRVVYNAIKAAEPRMGGAQPGVGLIPCVRYFSFCMGFDMHPLSSSTRAT